ncbi:MAG: NADH-quinone oxidoreductase subunit J [Candidatus Thorarchaeota archaeon]
MIDPFYLPDLALIIIGILTITAAIAALESREIVYGAVSLAGMFLGIAGLFILLDATFAAMFQISVYIGGVVVLIFFTIMVVPYEQWRYRLKRPWREWSIPLIINLVLLSVLIYIFYIPSVLNTYPYPGFSWDITDLALTILQDYGIALLILGLVLASALLGALTLTKKEVAP